MPTSRSRSDYVDPIRKGVVTSVRNPRVREVLALRRARDRRRSGLVVVEGGRIVERALRAGHRPVSAFVCPELPGADDGLIAWLEFLGTEVIEAGQAVMARLSVRDGPPGIVAVLPRPAYPAEPVVQGPAPLLAVLEGIERPSNLGAVVRTACAAGAEAVVVCDSPTDPYAPEAVASSVGAILTVPVVESSSAEMSDALRRAGVSLVATAPDASQPYWSVDLSGPVAVLLGNERRGLSEVWRSGAELVRVPMPGPMDSLNVAATGAVVLFEAVRQRSREGTPMQH